MNAKMDDIMKLYPESENHLSPEDDRLFSSLLEKNGKFFHISSSSRNASGPYENNVFKVQGVFCRLNHDKTTYYSIPNAPVKVLHRTSWYQISLPYLPDYKFIVWTIYIKRAGVTL